MLKAKDQFIEFANHIFLVILIIVAMIMLVTLGGVGFFIAIMQKLVPFSFVGFIFFIIARIHKKRSDVIKRGGIPEENLNYITAMDRVKSFLYTFIPPIAILGIGKYIGGGINPGDLAQSVGIFLIVNIWHLLLFNKNNLERVVFLTNRDEARDMMMICYISMIIFFFSDFKLMDWRTDVLQAVSAFVLMYILHKRLFRRRVK